MTIRDVVLHLNVGWDLVKAIQKRDLMRRYAKPKLKHLRYIAIDEIAVAKGHRYLTVVMDLESGAVVFVGDGKGADALKPFWKRLRPSKAKIEAVAMDMSRAYWWAVSTHLPKAKVVFDHFHVIKLFNEKLSDLRRSMYREATDVMHKEVLKGTRWLLLKNIPGRVDPPSRGIGNQDTPPDVQDTGASSHWSARVLRRDDQQRPNGGDEQQDKDDECARHTGSGTTSSSN